MAQNVVHALRKHRRGKDARADSARASSRSASTSLLPTRCAPSSPHLDGRWRSLLLTAIFTGLRASELRGLRWCDVDLKRGELHVRQRADRYRRDGRPKSEAGERAVPLPPMVVNTLREWKLACPKGDLDLVFAKCAGATSRPQEHHHQRGLIRPRSRPASSIADGRQVHRPARAAALLCELVHQPPRRWRTRIAAQGGAGAARPRLDPDDSRSLRPSVSTR